ncbi:hypothetical protein CB0940_06593 [Cercospora beticola]|uniref:Uncharacterized protein n=1 Tax=Cercospora beticola TaxID=122368 RepID=A0A2G5HY03_CERBT|nr:hypothetical protein CB0940_06593 [Cercospora beticola]PIA97444.1 hypothetical protein CB0940_06593 [Cercospora beticola]WPA99242.1 hypothetical protein RHO25_003858 [Cercospora beticola]
MPRYALHHPAPAEDFRGVLCPLHKREVCNHCWKKHIGMKIEDHGMIKCFCERVLGNKEIRLRAGEELWERYLEVKQTKEKDVQDAVLAAFKLEEAADKRREGDEGEKKADEDAEEEKEAEEDAGFICVDKKDAEAEEEWTMVDIEEVEI